MDTRRLAKSRSFRRAVLLSCALAACAVLLAPSPAAAVCLANPDAGLRDLQTLVAQDASHALKQAQAQLAHLDGAATTGGAAERRASLYAVEAQAYSMLELDAQARAVAQRGLKLATAPQDPVHLDLLSVYAENVYDAAGIAAALEQIEAARLAQPAGSPADTCLLITRGLLQFRQDRADLAIVSLTQAYRATAGTAETEPHALAAAELSAVMRGVGDYPQALALNQEAIDWYTAHHATLGLSVERFLRGEIYQHMENYGAALGEFTAARALSIQLDDRQGAGFADLRMCEAHIELRLWAVADGECRRALRAFAAARSNDSVKDARTLLARIDLGQGRPAAALAALNGVLDHRGADLPPRQVAAVYQWRARANAAMGNFAAAYEDLREYLRRYVAANDVERTRQESALRARFETDRQIERNASLQRELSVSQERTQRQAEELRWNAVVVVAGVTVIALLIYFLLANLKYRKQLLRLASLDSLTGLPNRRRTAELATAALAAADLGAQPLSLAIIDLDHFKVINDRCGHATGDHVLQEFARAGREALRGEDILGRWGGEEFLLVMPGLNLAQAQAGLERLRTRVLAIRLPSSSAGQRVTLSAGVAAYGPQVPALDELIARADSALYAAKDAGRDQVRVADERTQFTTTGIRRAMRR